MIACRNKIKDVLLDEKSKEKVSHAGLLLNRYLKIPVKDDNHPEARQSLLSTAICASVTAKPVYKAAFERWQDLLPQICEKATLQIQGRMAVGLGVDSVLETGIAIHHTYGVPYIPGSALKGLAAHYCNTVWGKNEDVYGREHGKSYEVLFGTNAIKGHITFFDAWIEPDSLRIGSGLIRDVMTPHHGDYYAGKSAPTDFDDPTPISFLSVVGSFHLAVSCDASGEDGKKWARLALTLLNEALKNWGVGGKTSSGYGRGSLEIFQSQEARLLEHQLFKELKTIGKPEYMGKIEYKINQAEKLFSDHPAVLIDWSKKALRELLIGGNKRKIRKRHKEKEWFKKLEKWATKTS